MRLTRTLQRLLLAFPIAALAFGASAVRAQDRNGELLIAAADCYSIGQKVAAEQGGQLARAVPMTRDGQQYCRIVILVPGRDGERPRRAEFIVPAE